MSILRGFLVASLTASLVISLKVIRTKSCGSKSKISARCQAIASPSRSGSVAKNIRSAFFAWLLNLLRVSPLPLMVIYFGLKSFSISTPNWLLGRSLTCPIEASIIYFDPKNFLIVFALAGDSTITKVFAIWLIPFLV